jgi:hypothetical protein
MLMIVHRHTNIHCPGHSKEIKKMPRKSLSRRSPKKSPRRKLRGGSWSCPLIYEVCRLAEGKSWDTTRAQLKEAMDEIREKQLGGFEERSSTFTQQVFKGRNQDVLEAAQAACAESKSTQAQHGKCIQSINRLREVIDDESKLQTRVPVDEEAHQRRLREIDEKTRQLGLGLGLGAQSKAVAQETREEYDKSSGLVQPYIDALLLLGKPTIADKRGTPTLIYSIRITDRLLVQFNVDGATLSIYAQLGTNAFVKIT